METIHRNYRGKEYDYQTDQGVIGRDYYKDHLVSQLHDYVLPLVDDSGKGIVVLDMATGHGYSAIIMADYYRDRVAKVVAYDINPRAVEMAHWNASRHACEDIIDFRVGTLYEPLRAGERFALVLSALPPIPVTTEQLSRMPKDVQSHHWVASTAGSTGRDLLDAMIKGAPPYLRGNGIIATATADFQNAVRHTCAVMEEYGFQSWRAGEPKEQEIRNTKLTALAKENILKLGYTFSKNRDGEEIFFIETYVGKTMPVDIR